MGLGNVRRYLIHHDDGGTWDLVVSGAGYSVEHTRKAKRQTFNLEEFEASEDGIRLADSLTLALARAITV